jgi:outer membrane protein assembly factor BamD (BamD/ComL family)
MKFTRVLLSGAFAGALFLSLGACNTVPKTIPQDLTAQQLVQKAQEESDANNYKASIVYYQALIDRYGSDLAFLCEGQYELAFIAYKEGRLADSQAGFEKLLALYTGPNADTLPQGYKILGQKILAHVKSLLAAKK